MAYKQAYIWNGTEFDKFGVQATESLLDYAKINPTTTQTISNTTLSSPSINTPNISGGSSSGIQASGSILIAPEERWNISATAVTSTTNVDYISAQNWYYTVAGSTGASIINIRGDATTTLSSLLSVGDSITLSVAITTGSASASYFNTVRIDGTTTGVTTRWQYNAVPTSGTSNGVDVYSLTVLKTNSTPSYTVFASSCRW